MKLSLAFSPCPNDTFIFYGIATGKIKSPIQYRLEIGDVEELNQAAFKGRYSISKLSFHALAQLVPNYQVLDSGAALGMNCGPLVISQAGTVDQINKASIAIPGIHTTANLLFTLAYPQANKKTYVLFSEIENMITAGKVEYGVIIHESRFTYQQKGLIKVRDLGQFWEASTGMAIPLGAIGVKRDLEPKIKQQIEKDIRSSLMYARDHQNDALKFCSQYAQEMEKSVMMQHIDLYVNQFSESLKLEGRNAVIRLYDEIRAKNIVDIPDLPIFLSWPAEQVHPDYQ